MFGDPLGGTGGEPAVSDDNFTFDIVDEPQPAPAPPGSDAAPAGPAAPAQPVQPSGAPAAQPRDAQRTTAQPSATPPVPPAGAPPTPPVAGEAAPAAAATQPEDPLAAYPVWEVRADGQDFEIPGSRLGTNGVWLDKEAVPLVQQLIAEGVANRGSARQMREQLESENQQLRSRLTNDPDIIKAKAFNTQIMRLLAAGPEAVQAWLEDFTNNRQSLVAQAEQAILRQQVQERDQQLLELQQRAEADQLEPVMGSALENTVAELAARPEFAGVDADLIMQRLYSPQGLDAVFLEVDPRERPRGPNENEFYLGTSADGKLYLMDWGVIVQEFQYQASIRGATAPATPAAAAAINATALAGAPPQGPTTGAPPPGNLPAGAGEQVPDFPKTPEGRRQMEQWFDRRYSPIKR